jgi:hypothetical protein
VVRLNTGGLFSTTGSEGTRQQLVRLLADEYEDPSKQRENSHDHYWNGDRKQGHEADEDEINGKQKHTNVFSEVHAASILIGRSSDNPNLL